MMRVRQRESEIYAFWRFGDWKSFGLHMYILLRLTYHDLYYLINCVYTVMCILCDCIKISSCVYI